MALALTTDRHGRRCASKRGTAQRLDQVAERDNEQNERVLDVQLNGVNERMRARVLPRTACRTFCIKIIEYSSLSTVCGHMIALRVQTEKNLTRLFGSIEPLFCLLGDFVKVFLYKNDIALHELFTRRLACRCGAVGWCRMCSACLAMHFWLGARHCLCCSRPKRARRFG